MNPLSVNRNATIGTVADVVPMTASAIGIREFTFETFHQLTPGMVGASRAAIFTRLPLAIQDQAWREDAERVRALREEEP